MRLACVDTGKKARSFPKKKKKKMFTNVKPPDIRSVLLLLLLLLGDNYRFSFWGNTTLVFQVLGLVTSVALWSSTRAELCKSVGFC